MQRKVQKFPIYLVVFASFFFITLLSLAIYTFFYLPLDIDESVGRGIFYLKGHYLIGEESDGEIRRKELGMGLVTIPLFSSFAFTCFYWIVDKILYKK